MAIEIIFANVGAGKTTYAVMRAIKELKRMQAGKSIYDDIYINTHVKGIKYLDIPKVLKTHAIQNALLIIDEASIEYNNRLMKLNAREIEFFKLHRHYNVDIIVVSQSFEDIDITLRRMYSRMFMLKNLYLFDITMIREIKKFMTIDENLQFVEGYEFVKFPKFFRRKKYYAYFDSYCKPDYIPIFVDESDFKPYLLNNPARLSAFLIKNKNIE